MTPKEIKLHIRNLMTGCNRISQMPMTTRVIIGHLIKQLEDAGEAIDSDIRELFAFNDVVIEQ